jgi:DNA-binding XRE family transcriptional regulator
MGKPGGTLYAIVADGSPYVKIGSTKKAPLERLAQLQTGHPHRLTICASAAIAANVHAVERAVHRFLEERHFDGEWFALEPLDNAMLEQLILDAIQHAQSHPEVRMPRKVRQPSARHHDDENLPIFAERLLATRRRLQLSQEDLATKAGMFKTDISKYERSISLPNIERLVRLAQALGVGTDYLLGLADRVHPADGDVHTPEGCAYA